MPLTKTKPKPATYADIEALPPNIVGEILFGALHTQPRPTPRHSRAAGELHVELSSPFDRGHGGGPGGWLFLPEPEIHLGDHVIVPDIAGWRRERLAVVPDTAFIDIAPDWVTEILSPSTQQRDRTDKLAIYAEYHVGHAWYVDPAARTLEAMTLTGGKWLITETCKDDDEVTAPPFEVHTFSLGVLWPQSDPEAT